MFLFCSVSRQSDKQARAEAMLGELAELSLVVARELAVRLRESEDVERDRGPGWGVQQGEPRDAADAGARRRAGTRRRARCGHRGASGAGRPTVAAADLARTAEPADPARALKGRVRGLMKRLLWSESEGDYQDFEVLVENLNARLPRSPLRLGGGRPLHRQSAWRG